MEHENLNGIIEAYSNDPFELENRLTLQNCVSLTLDLVSSNGNYLELGIGNGITLNALSDSVNKLNVVEGATLLIKRYEDRFKNVTFIHDYFEEFQPLVKYQHIGMSFVLEHVDDPAEILLRYKSFLTQDGCIFVGVPNASSMHRRLGKMAGFLDDINKLSDADRRFGHKRLFSYEQWHNLFDQCGFHVKTEKGLFMKPISQSQMQELKLHNEIYKALCVFAWDYPEIANSCFFQLVPK